MSVLLHMIENLHGARLAGKALMKMMKRWPSMISKFAITLTNNLQDPNAEEYAVLGSCSVLASQIVLKHLTMVIVEDVVLELLLWMVTIYCSFLHIFCYSRIVRCSLHLS